MFTLHRFRMTESVCEGRRLSGNSGFSPDARRQSIFRRPSHPAGLRTTNRSRHEHRTEDPHHPLHPKSGHVFDTGCVQRILVESLSAFLDGGRTYEYSRCVQMTLELAEVIRSRVKELEFLRYRFVCHVIVAQNAMQGLEYASRCLWDAKSENYASVSYSEGDLVAVATVFGVYLD